MTPLAKKVAELFGKPETAMEPAKPRLRTVTKPERPERPTPRAFLARPLGQEDNPDPWDAWEPFMVWLLEHYPEYYHLVCDAEDRLSALECQGITTGTEYEEACTELQCRFETVRRLALKDRVKVWIQ